jgi:hypothetical protein
MHVALTLAAAWLAGFLALLAGCDRSERSLAGSAASGACKRPYSPAGPWNTPIPGGTRYADGLAVPGPLTSDPTQYTYPVYRAGARTPRRTLRVDGVYSNVGDRGRQLALVQNASVRVPIPAGVMAAAGSDAQIVIVNPATGDEWGAWQLRRDGGGFRAENAYHYNTRWSGVPPRTSDGRPFGSRGAGVPYLAGLVRPCEIARGRIDHALAFAYDSPSPAHVYPATKSDGTGRGPSALPEGTRLQLDPSLSGSRIRSWGCTRACFVVARALQRYGMFVIDASGRPKLMFEYVGTARWRGAVHASTVSPIPLRALRVVR